MTKDLIFIDGQEGFVDLELLESWRCFINGTCRESGYHQILNLSFNKDAKGRWVYIPFNPAERNMLISMQISYRNLSRIYYEVVNNFDNRIAALRKKFERARNPVIKAKWNDAIRHVLKEMNQSDADVDFGVINSLLEKLPKKFYERRTQRIRLKIFSNVDALFLECDVLKIRVVAIPYLECQYGLGRIKLNWQEIAMVKSMKELLKIKDDVSTFDSYIDKWTERLIHEVTI
jgi:hypothetical protein